MLGCRATFRGRARRSIPESGKRRCKAGAWCGGSTSTATARAICGHGGEHRAVFVYQIESYRYWQTQLGRDDFVHGQFGENFTVDGLPDAEVCIGDRYRIGSALFEVTQPRVTCYRVGIRMNEPQMAALLVAHHRPGFYFRVHRGRRGRSRRRDRQGRGRPRADERRRNRRAAVFARARQEPARTGAAHPGVKRGLALVVRNLARARTPRRPGRRQSRRRARGSAIFGMGRLPAAAGVGQTTREQ